MSRREKKKKEGRAYALDISRKKPSSSPRIKKRGGRSAAGIPERSSVEKKKKSPPYPTGRFASTLPGKGKKSGEFHLQE